MAKENKSSKSTGNAKIVFNTGSKAKKTSIGKSRNSRKIDKSSVREKKGHK